MINQIVLIGRLNKITKQEKGVVFEIKVKREYKNEEGDNIYDYILCVFANNCAEEMYKLTEIGSLVAIKGRLRTEEDRYYIQCDKVTYLSNKGGEE